MPKQFEGNEQYIITNITLDKILKLFRTDQDKEDFVKCWGWGLLEWKRHVTCQDCEYSEIISDDVCDPLWCRSWKHHVFRNMSCAHAEAIEG